MQNQNQVNSKKILLVANNFSFFYSHRYPLIKQLVREGFRFYIACDFEDENHARILKLSEKNINFFNISIDRSSVSPIKNIKIILSIYKLLNEINPSTLWLVSSKPNIFGGIASLLSKDLRIIYSISGLGYVFINKGIKSAFIQKFIVYIYRFLLSKNNTITIFQNNYDLALFKSQKIRINNPAIIRGVGVDVERYSRFKNYHNGNKVNILFCSRLLIDKGVYEFIEAARIYKDDDSFTFSIAGGLDSKNPKSISQDKLELILKSENIKYHGEISHDEMPNFLNEFDILVMPSYREGFPKIILEAASTGLAIIATDVPGCNELVMDEVNGFLVKPKDSHGIAVALKKFADNPELIYRFGKSSREMVLNRFGLKTITNEFKLLLIKS